MKSDRFRLTEHLAVTTSLPLPTLCRQVEQELGLPPFRFDSENDTEWGAVLQEGIEYNLSRPYQQGTLKTWDDTVPAGCNLAITLMITRDCDPTFDQEWSLKQLVPTVGQRLADLLNQAIHHHRTWLGPGRNVPRNRVFCPGRRSAP